MMRWGDPHKPCEKLSRGLFCAALISCLSACGGGGSGDNGGTVGGGSSLGGSGSGGSSSGWTAGVYQPHASFKDKCASPRSGASAVTGRPFPDTQGTALDERNWLRSWTNDLYLWYGEVPDLNPANYSTPTYFEQLKTSATTPSGQPKDKFHFSAPTSQWEALSQNNSEASYGLRWEIIPATFSSPPRVFVAYLEPGANTPAAQAGLIRGDEVQVVDGVSLSAVTTQSQADTVNNGIYPTAPGQFHTFTIREVGGTVRTVSMQSVQVTNAPVMNVQAINTGSGVVGYLQFNDHLGTAEQALIDAFNTLKASNGGLGVSDLILDMRYNSGGSLGIASQLAYMITGAAQTAGQTFAIVQFNDKHPTTDPVTGNALAPTPFYNVSTAGQPLPTLNLPRVFILTGASTCSASEAVINGLRGVDVQVIQIGSRTCGKPYGYYPADNCGTTYFSIQLRLVNADNFGDYSDGFSPANTVGTTGVSLPGCSVADDFDHELGDPLEGRLAVALNYRLGANCPGATGMGPENRVQAQSVTDPISEASRLIRRPFWRESLILR